MALLSITITKGVKSDAILIARSGGAPMRFDFPKKGPVPHDAVHLIVEGALGMTRGFWGMVADGANPVEIQDIAKAAGHASAKRANIPEPQIVELIQAERFVECFEAELWSPGADPQTFRDIAAAACATSRVPCPDLADGAIDEIRCRISALAREWGGLGVGQSLAFNWPA